MEIGKTQFRKDYYLERCCNNCLYYYAQECRRYPNDISKEGWKDFCGEFKRKYFVIGNIVFIRKIR